MPNPEFLELLKEPQTMEELNVPQNIIIDILLRLLYNEGNVNFTRISQVMRIPVAIQSLLEWMKQEHVIEISKSSSTFNPFNYMYKLSTVGIERAKEALERSQYVGPVPVPVNIYQQVMEAQSQVSRMVSIDEVKDALADMVLPDDTHRRIGPAVNIGSSLFLYGPSGNGKTTIAKKIAGLISGQAPVWIPYALTAGGQIIQIHDRLYHTQASNEDREKFGNIDGRWGLFKRPVVIVGGELKLDSLDLRYDGVARIYEAPLQVKANLGMFLIDDFGRQQISPMELLNRWILPLENHVDYMRLKTGQTLVVPFSTFIVFSTNLNPYELADDAFYRRVQIKVGIFSPDEQLFRKIFIKACEEVNMRFDENAFQHLCEKWYRQPKRRMQAVHPRDLVKIIEAVCNYEKSAVKLEPELIDEACACYFVEGE